MQDPDQILDDVVGCADKTMDWRQSQTHLKSALFLILNRSVLWNRPDDKERDSGLVPMSQTRQLVEHSPLQQRVLPTMDLVLSADSLLTSERTRMTFWTQRSTTFFPHKFQEKTSQIEMDDDKTF